MNTTGFNSRRIPPALLVLFCGCLLAGCDYDVPITAAPTRKVEARLLGDWVSQDGMNTLKVRRFDDSNYVIALNDELARVHHSDVGDIALATLQELESTERQYIYVRWTLSGDDRRLNWRIVRYNVVPKDIKDSAEVRKLVEKNRDHPDLFTEEQTYLRVKKDEP